MRLVNLAHGEFLLLGAYFGLFFVQATGVDPLIGLPVVGLVIAALSIPLYRLLLAAARRPGSGGADDDHVRGLDHPAERLCAPLQRRHPLDSPRATPRCP